MTKDQPYQLFNALLLKVASGRLKTHEFEAALDSYLKSEIESLRAVLSGSEFEQIRIVWNRNNLHLRCSQKHVSFSALNSLLGPILTKSIEARLKVVSVLNSTFPLLSSKSSSN